MDNDEQDELRINEVHATLKEGKPLIDVVAPWGLDEAKRIIGLVQDDYINDFNRALNARQGEAPSLNVASFRSGYDALWQAKLDLDRGRYAAAYRKRFGDDPE